jgi:hypothetical protein
MGKPLSNEQRQRLTERAETLRMELGRTPRRRVGDLLWQRLARKLLTCERRLRLYRLQQHLNDERNHPVA